MVGVHLFHFKQTLDLLDILNLGIAVYSYKTFPILISEGLFNKLKIVTDIFTGIRFRFLKTDGESYMPRDN